MARPPRRRRRRRRRRRGQELLTTSQAAALAGISHTHLRNLTSEGVIPVQYRGSHRRIRRSDVQTWLAGRQRDDAGGAPAAD
ncbi:helix-turn-helix domain-containing protein [Kocuria sp. CNJ-770]|uniref:helix-turn-helix domain-containing protein n=1 Tax=Kocuria sp. CNJ-770 TaxID=1904964 RepID=UPI0009F97C01|nr:helix-turn-helix domain-containing protein [Kocuria sp. CNJ-770]